MISIVVLVIEFCIKAILIFEGEILSKSNGDYFFYNWFFKIISTIYYYAILNRFACVMCLYLVRCRNKRNDQIYHFYSYLFAS